MNYFHSRPLFSILKLTETFFYDTLRHITMRRNGAPQNITDAKFHVIDIGASFETRLVI